MPECTKNAASFQRMGCKLFMIKHLILCIDLPFKCYLVAMVILILNRELKVTKKHGRKQESDCCAARVDEKVYDERWDVVVSNGWWGPDHRRQYFVSFVWLPSRMQKRAKGVWKSQSLTAEYRTMLANAKQKIIRQTSTQTQTHIGVSFTRSRGGKNRRRK